MGTAAPEETLFPQVFPQLWKKIPFGSRTSDRLAALLKT